MCLIIASKTGIVPTEEQVKDAFESNPHGWGIMWAINGTIKVFKGFTLDGVQAAVKEAQGKPFVLHFRWATHGHKIIENNHPFKINKHLWMAHNGIIRSVKEFNKGMSDTWHYAQKVKLDFKGDPRAKNAEVLIEDVEDDVTTSNKVVFLRSDGKILIANKWVGTERDGLWFSNTQTLYKTRQYTGYGGQQCGYGYGNSCGSGETERGSWNKKKENGDRNSGSSNSSSDSTTELGDGIKKKEPEAEKSGEGSAQRTEESGETRTQSLSSSHTFEGDLNPTQKAEQVYRSYERRKRLQEILSEDEDGHDDSLREYLSSRRGEIDSVDTDSAEYAESMKAMRERWDKEIGRITFLPHDDDDNLMDSTESDEAIEMRNMSGDTYGFVPSIW